MAAIDIGPGATNRGTIYSSAGVTCVDINNPANDSGVLDTFEVWGNGNLANCVVGTFSGSGTSYDDRDFESIGAVTGGSKQTFTGKNCDVVLGDYVGTYFAGVIERDTSGFLGVYLVAGQKFNSGAATYTLSANNAFSIYATGYTLTAPTVTTQDATSITTSTCTANGNITDTGGVAPTIRGHCWVAGVAGDPTTADSEAHEDGSFSTGAYTTAITGLTPGTGYRVRAYATNSIGTSYGDTVQVTTHAIQIVVGGLFKAVSAISVLVGGVWKTTKPSVLVGGVWKQ